MNNLSKLKKKNGLLSISNAQLQRHLDCYHQQLPRTASTSPTTTISPSLSPKGGQFTNDQKQRIEEKLLSGQYKTTHEMATDIHDGVPSKITEDVIFKNMMKIRLQKFNE